MGPFFKCSLGISASLCGTCFLFLMFNRPKYESLNQLTNSKAIVSCSTNISFKIGHIQAPWIEVNHHQCWYRMPSSLSIFQMSLYVFHCWDPFHFFQETYFRATWIETTGWIEGWNDFTTIVNHKKWVSNWDSIFFGTVHSIRTLPFVASCSCSSSA